VTSRNLPTKRKRIRIQKFAYGSLILIAAFLIVSSPYTYFASQTKYWFQEQHTDKLNSFEEVKELIRSSTNRRKRRLYL